MSVTDENECQVESDGGKLLLDRHVLFGTIFKKDVNANIETSPGGFVADRGQS